MKNKMPLDGLGLGHDSGSVHCDMLKMLCFRTAWGGQSKAVYMCATLYKGGGNTSVTYIVEFYEN